MNNSGIIFLQNACATCVKRAVSFLTIIVMVCLFGPGRAIAADIWTIQILYVDDSVAVYVDNNLVSTCYYGSQCTYDLSSRISTRGKYD